MSNTRLITELQRVARQYRELAEDIPGDINKDKPPTDNWDHYFKGKREAYKQAAEAMERLVETELKSTERDAMPAKEVEVIATEYTKETTGGGWIYVHRSDNKMPVALVHPEHVDKFIASLDMYEALKELMPTMKSILGNTIVHPVMIDICNKAIKALAKAKGD